MTPPGRLPPSLDPQSLLRLLTLADQYRVGPLLAAVNAAFAGLPLPGLSLEALLQLYQLPEVLLAGGALAGASRTHNVADLLRSESVEKVCAAAAVPSTVVLWAGGAGGATEGCLVQRLLPAFGFQIGSCKGSSYVTRNGFAVTTKFLL